MGQPRNLGLIAELPQCPFEKLDVSGPASSVGKPRGASLARPLPVILLLGKGGDSSLMKRQRLAKSSALGSRVQRSGCWALAAGIPMTISIANARRTESWQGIALKESAAAQQG